MRYLTSGQPGTFSSAAANRPSRTDSDIDSGKPPSPERRLPRGIPEIDTCFFAVELKNRLSWDDALDVWGVHGVGGFLGIVLLGVFASTAFNPAGTNGLVAGNGAFVLKQLVAVAVSSVWAFGFTYGMLWLIDQVTPVKVDQAGEERCLDEALHGETPYLGAG